MPVRGLVATGVPACKCYNPIKTSIRLIKRRTVAKDACDGGRVMVNGKVVKAGATVAEGDTVTITFGNKEIAVRVLQLTEGSKKADAIHMYEVIE